MFLFHAGAGVCALNMEAMGIFRDEQNAPPRPTPAAPAPTFAPTATFAAAPAAHKPVLVAKAQQESVVKAAPTKPPVHAGRGPLTVHTVSKRTLQSDGGSVV